MACCGRTNTLVAEARADRRLTPLGTDATGHTMRIGVAACDDFAEELAEAMMHPCEHMLRGNNQVWMSNRQRDSFDARHSKLFAQRTLAIVRYISLIVMLACFAAGIVVLFRRGGWGLVWTFIGLGYVSEIFWFVWIARYRKRLVRRLDAAGWCLCPECGYDLSGHSRLPGEIEGPREAMACPECGLVSRLVRVREAWREVFGKGNA